MSVKSQIPWPAKIAAKIFLSRLPVTSGFWKKVRLFEPGSMDEPAYAYQVFKKHFDTISRFASPKKGFSCLELGPGDSLFTAMITNAFGGEVSYLVDVGEYALSDVQQYETMGIFLSEKGLVSRSTGKFRSLEEYLACYSAKYMPEGLASLKTIPDESVDFQFSHAVLEHIKRSEFLDTMRELRRIIRSDGAASHRIDLQDHLSGSLNNLRFSHRMWESDLMSQSGFYTNRIQYSELLDLLRSADFEPTVLEEDRWPELPLPRSSLSKSFRGIPDDELCVSGFSVHLKPV